MKKNYFVPILTWNSWRVNKILFYFVMHFFSADIFYFRSDTDIFRILCPLVVEIVDI